LGPDVNLFLTTEEFLYLPFSIASNKLSKGEDLRLLKKLTTKSISFLKNPLFTCDVGVLIFIFHSSNLSAKYSS
jgi:hypothetical protein